ncbi:MAG: C45 family autoproteolytic acyltransferase/hydrolase [Candidatus Hydrogenedentes bacterium]|nr:C45 family autoproteolytic acyltransferase/hydrolase [Candidatus Hydrogenedentota bacterium]
MRVTNVTPDSCETLRVSGPGFLEVYHSGVGNVPVLHVEGIPEEMGRQYGALVGDMIRRNIDRMLGLFSGMGLPEAVVHLVLDKTWERLAPHTLDRYHREMAAIAEGAQEAGFVVTVADVQRLTAVTNFDLYRREERIMELFGADIAAHFAANGAPPGPACTMFSVWGSRTVDGKMFAIRNLDWVSQTGMHEDRLVTVYRPNGLNSFVTMDYAGVVGGIAGMNEKGIAFSEVGAFSASEELDGTPWILIARRVLAVCSKKPAPSSRPYRCSNRPNTRSGTTIWWLTATARTPARRISVRARQSSKPISSAAKPSMKTT